MHPAAYLKRPGADLPPPETGETRYIVARNGLFVERRTPIFTTTARIYERELDLEDHVEMCRLHCPRLPRVLHRAMLGFFSAAHAMHGGEAALVLLFHPERRVYRWHCPEQTIDLYYSWYKENWVAEDTIRFQNPMSMPDGFIHFGDAHLHPGAPTPSALDIADDQDGLHIIVGDIKSRPRYNVEFVIDRRRFRIPPESFFEDASCAPFGWVPNFWMKQIHLQRIGNATTSNKQNGSWNNNQSWNNSGEKKPKSGKSKRKRFGF